MMCLPLASFVCILVAFLCLASVAVGRVRFDGPWEILSENAPPLDTRASSAYNGSVYLFPEGYAIDWDEDERTVNHVYRFYDFKQFKSEIIMTNGDAPIVRDDFCTATVGDTIYLFGGLTDSFMSDLNALDMKTLTWTQIQPVGDRNPDGRRFPVCFEYQGKLHLYSGYLPVDVADDLWSYDPQSNQWIKIGYNSPKFPYVYTPIIAVYKDILYVYGGRNVLEVIVNDFWSFSFVSKTWSVVTLSNPNQYELPGSYLGSFATIGNMLYFVAGQNKNDDNLV
eukprot:30164_3